MEENIIKVYVKIDNNNVITEINSSTFIVDTIDWIQVDEGEGDIFAHAQGNYLANGLIDDDGKYNYKLVNGVIESITDEEKEILFPEPVSVPTIEDQVQSLQEENASIMFALMEGGIL